MSVEESRSSLVDETSFVNDVDELINVGLPAADASIIGVSSSKCLDDKTVELALLKLSLNAGTRPSETRNTLLPNSWNEANRASRWNQQQLPVPVFQPSKSLAKKSSTTFRPRPSHGKRQEKNKREVGRGSGGTANGGPGAVQLSKDKDSQLSSSVVIHDRYGALPSRDINGQSNSTGIYSSGATKYFSSSSYDVSVRSSTDVGIRQQCERLGAYLEGRQKFTLTNAKALSISHRRDAEKMMTQLQLEPSLTHMEELDKQRPGQFAKSASAEKVVKQSDEVLVGAGSRRVSITDLAPEIKSSHAQQKSLPLSYSRTLEGESGLRYAMRAEQQSEKSSTTFAKARRHADQAQLQALETRAMQLDAARHCNIYSTELGALNKKQARRTLKRRKEERGQNLVKASMSAVIAREFSTTELAPTRTTQSAIDLPTASSQKPYWVAYPTANSTFDSRTGTVFPPIPQAKQRTVSIPSTEQWRQPPGQVDHYHHQIKAASSELLPSITGQRCYAGDTMAVSTSKAFSLNTSSVRPPV